MVQTDTEAIKILDNTELSALKREEAVYRLGRHPDERAIKRLVQALEDNDFGVRWAAAVALSELGRKALLPLLQALTQRADDPWLREGVYHVLHYNSDPRVRDETHELRQALKGPAANIASAETAFKLMHELEQRQ